MPKKVEEFTEHHLSQYQNLANDMRFLGDQHFKIVTVYMVITGLVGNIAMSHSSVILGGLGCVLSYLCLSWDKRTTQWWAILREKTKQLERLAHSDGKMIEAYTQYPQRPLRLFLTATLATESIYYLGFIVWVLYIIYSWPILWK